MPIVLTSYDIERRAPYFFKTRQAQKSVDRNHYLTDAARATSAAPTFFDPAKVKSLAAKPTTRYLVDGGVFVNNPAMCAYVEAFDHKGPDEKIVLTSLGTGIATRSIANEDAEDWGALGWARPIISVMMDGQADCADYHANLVLPGADAGQDQRYFRFDKALTLALDDMDAAHAANIRALQEEAAIIIGEQGAEIERLLALLTS